MHRPSRSLGLLGALTLAAAVHAPTEANACGGGTFYEVEVSDDETIATTGHRVVIAMSKTQTVLWDQIQFAGAPEDFAWIYPIKPGARLELATDAWIEALDSGTATIVRSPEAYCYEGGESSGADSGGCSCAPGAGAGDANGGGDRAVVGQTPPVTVVHQATIGPYDTQTISSDTPGAIGAWLSENGYAIPASVQPVLDDYVAEGFDFIALRLAPGQGVSRMKPVRVVTPGPTTTFPMRMLGAGAGEKVALNVVVLTEGRVSVEGFTGATLDTKQLVWDFDKGTSNHDAVRADALAQNGGATFLTTYSRQQDLFVDWQNGPGAIETFAAHYFALAAQNQEGDAGCTDKLTPYRDPASEQSGYTVVDPCDDMGTCADLGPSEIDAKDLACGAADDLATAMIGMHPKDVWITRFEADLPKQALSKDLVLAPLASTTGVQPEITAASSAGDPCNAGGSGAGEDEGGGGSSAMPLPPSPRPRSPLPPTTVALLGAGLALLFAATRRVLAPRGARRVHA